MGAYAKSYLYDSKQGLSHNIIQSIVKDKQGKLWVGTQKGLNTFDGYSFSPVTGLEDCIIHDLLYDSLQNHVWAATSKGLFRIDIYSGTLINCTAKIRDHDVRHLTSFSNNIYAVFLDGRILGISPEYRCWFVNNTVRDAAGNAQQLLKAVFDGEGYAYLGIQDAKSLVAVHLVNRNRVNLPFILSSLISSSFSGKGACIVKYNIDKGAILFLNATSKDIQSIRYQLPESPSDEGLSSIYQDGDLYYFGFSDGCRIYKRDTVHRIFVLIEEKTDEYFFRSRALNVIYLDKANVLLLGTNKGLIKKVLSQRQPFSLLFKYPNARLSIRQILKGGDSVLYFSTYDGLYKYDTRKNTAIHLSPQLFRSGVYVPPYIYAGRETYSDFFFRLNVETGQLSTTFFKKEGSVNQIRTVWSMFHAGNGVIWMGTNKGLASCDIASNRLILHDSGSFSAGHEDLYYLSPNGDSTQLIAAGKGGVYLVDVGLHSVKNLNHSNRPELPDDEFIFSGTHPDGSYWFGTKSSGVVNISKDLKYIKVYDKKYGLSNNEVYSVLWADSGEAWITTAAGLNRFDLSQQIFDTYFYEDGIADDEFNQNSFLADGGKIYAGGIDGVTMFSPNDIIHRTNQVTIFCTSVSKWSNNTLSSMVTDYRNSIEMEPQYQLLKFTFGLSDYSTTEDNSYFYQIKGINNKWTPLGNANTLSLEGLSPGKYEVSIIGYNKFGNKSVNVLTFNVQVKQIYYQTVWFYGLVIIVFSFLIIAYYRWRLKQANMRFELRTKISSNLHDEVGSLLTGIIVSTDSARLASATPVEKENKLKRISDLSREAVNTMSDVLWSIDARNDKTGSFTDRIQEHGMNMFEGTQIEVRFDILDADQEQFMEPDTRQQLYLIYKEALNNVIKHSNATYVKIRYAQKGKHFELIIENDQNDPGKPVNMSGQGMHNMEMRAGRVEADFSVDNTGELFRIRVIR